MKYRTTPMSGNFSLMCNDDINAQMSDRVFGWKMEIHSALMYSHRAERHRVDCVDLDPYGTAAPFIDAAVQCVNDGGMFPFYTIPLSTTPSGIEMISGILHSQQTLISAFNVPLLE